MHVISGPYQEISDQERGGNSKLVKKQMFELGSWEKNCRRRSYSLFSITIENIKFVRTIHNIEPFYRTTDCFLNDTLLLWDIINFVGTIYFWTLFGLGLFLNISFIELRNELKS